MRGWSPVTVLMVIVLVLLVFLLLGHQITVN